MNVIDLNCSILVCVATEVMRLEKNKTKRFYVHKTEQNTLII